jgi:protein-disulfide isomerase
MYDRLFDEQESFGLKPWSDYAKEAGVPDLVRFDTCIKETGSVARIEEGKRLGQKLDIKATPTLIVNGWMLGRPPTADELDAMVKAVLSGKSPVAGKT